MPTNKYHPNLVIGLGDADVGEFIGELLQTVRNLEEQRDKERKQLNKERETLKREKEKLENQWSLLQEERKQLARFQAFISKLAIQIEANEPSDQIDNIQLPKQRRNGSSR